MSMMAGTDASRNVQVNLTANVDPFQRAMQTAGQSVSALAGGVAKLGVAIDDLVKRAGRKMVLVGTGELAGLTAAAEAANRLDVAMRGVRATSAVTGQSVGALKSQIMDMSRSIPDSTNNIARLVGEIQNLGIQGTKNIRDFTVMAERLGAATNTPPGQLLSGIVAMNREMGSGLATVSNYSSALIELSKMNGVSANDIMGFANSIQSVAQQAGYTQTQVMGMATAFTRAGADSSAAANVFVTITSEINQAIVTNNAQLQQFGQLIGMTAQQFRAFAQSHPEQAFQKILGAIEQQGQKGILTLQQMGLDGPRALRVIASLTSGQANMAQSMNQASNAYTRNQALTKSSNAAWADLSATMQKFRNNVDDIVIRLGGPMLHVLDMFFKALNILIAPLNMIMNSFLGPMIGIVAGIGGAFLAVTGTITAFSVALLGAAGAWRALSGMTGTNSLQGFVSGLRAPQGTPANQGARTMFRQRPVDLTNRSNAANRIFETTYGLGQRMTAPPPEDPTMVQRAMGATGRAAGSVLRFPIRKLGWEAKEAANTLAGYDPHRAAAGGRLLDFRAITDYTRRSNEAVNPMSLLGMFQGGQRGVSATHDFISDQITSARDAGRSNVQRLRDRFKTDHGLLGGVPPIDLKVNATSAEEAVARIKETIKSPTIMPVTIKTTQARGAGPFDLNLTTRSGSTVAGEEEMAQKLLAGGPMGSPRTRTALGMAGRGVGTAMTALGSFASAVSDVIMPLGLLAAVGIPLYEGFKHLHNSAQDAANNMDDLGAALVRTAGGTYNKPTAGAPQAPADRINPFGQGEIGTATSSGFAHSAGGDIGRLRGREGVNRTRTAQNLVQNVIANNNGQSLTTGQQQALREELIAAYGPQGAQEVYKQLNLGGVAPVTAARNNANLLAGVRDDSNIFQGRFQGSNSSKRIRDAVTPIANQLNSGQFAAAGLGLAAMGSALPGAQRSYQDIIQHGGWQMTRNPNDDVLRLQRGAGSILSQLNKGVPGKDQIHIDTAQIFSVRDFIEALHNGNQRARTFADQLSKAGLNVNDLAGSMNTLNTAVQHSVTVQTANRINQTRIGGLANQAGFNLSDPTDVNYARNLATLTSSVEAGGRRQAPDMTNTAAIQRAIAAWTDYKNTLAATDPAVQGVQAQIDSLNQSLQAQNAIFQTPQQQAAGFANQAQSMINQFGTGGMAGQDEQSYMGMAQQQVASAENQLKSYMTTVHEYHIQEKDAFYQRNLQIKQMNHEFAEQIRQMNFATANTFGNPAQMVQSQFTMGADQALIGMRRQVDMLRSSKQTMDALQRTGLSRDAIRLLGLDDPKNVEQAQRYLGELAANPKLVQQFNKSIKGRLQIANGIDTDVNNSKFADMKRQFNYTANQAAAAFHHAQEQAATSINELGQVLFTSFADLNHQAMQSGLVNIQNFASSIVTQIAHVRNVTTSFLNSTLRSIGGQGPGGGGGSSPTGSYNPGSLQGGVSGGGKNYGDLGASSGSHRVPIKDAHGKVIDYETVGTRNTFVNPGTGKVLSFSGSNANRGGTSGSGRADYRPSDAFMREHPAQPGFNKSIAQAMMSGFGWGKGEWDSLNKLWTNESGWNQYADNKVSDAYGIPQALPGTKMGSAGKDWRTNPATQIKWGLQYIAGRYGDPMAAWKHEEQTGWYAKGGVFGSRQVIGVGENGPEAVLPLNATGANFIAQIVQRSGITKAQVAMTHTAPKSSVVFSGNVSNHMDYSTEYTGDIHVEASDPNEMQRKLEAKKRLDALRRPVAAR